MKKQKIPVNTVRPKEELLLHIPLGDEMPYDFQKAHRHEYFEFFIFEKGGGRHYIDFMEYEILPYSVHIVFPSQVHLLRRAGARGQIIICRKEFMNSLPRIFYTQLYQNIFASPGIAFGTEQFADLKQTAQRLEEEAREKHVLSGELIRSLFCLFLSRCIRQPKAQEGKGSRQPVYSPQELEIYREFNARLETDFLNKLNVSDYAKALNITPKVLNNSVGKITGKTSVQLIQERTLLEAKRLLLFSGDSAKEIAYELGFKDNSYFTRFFTRMEGMTPKAFKTFWEEKYHS